VLDDGREPTVLAAKCSETRRLRGGGRIGELAFDLGGASERVCEAILKSRKGHVGGMKQETAVDL
jgi:hypothetical protein